MTWRSLVAFVATIVTILALAVLPLLSAPFAHAALDAAGSARLLGLAPAIMHELSDRSVAELVAGPGTFLIAAPDGTPFYDAAERRHLGDARVLLWLLLVAGAVSAGLLCILLVAARGMVRASLWRAVSRAGATAAIAVVVLAVAGLVAFEPLFGLFHEVFFPAGGWSFDPTTQRLVQLYPFVFWQIAAAGLGLLALILGVAAWALGRRLARPEAGR
jgi:integral membrane protein (TIGR01906 family)